MTFEKFHIFCKRAFNSIQIQFVYIYTESLNFQGFIFIIIRKLDERKSSIHEKNKKNLNPSQLLCENVFFTKLNSVILL